MGDRLAVDLPSSNYSLDIVLVGINHPGNLGAICRTMLNHGYDKLSFCLLYTSPSPRDKRQSRMPSSA